MEESIGSCGADISSRLTSAILRTVLLSSHDVEVGEDNQQGFGVHGRLSVFFILLHLLRNYVQMV